MSFIDILVGLFAITLVLFTVLHNLRKKRRGESGCGGCCGGLVKETNASCRNASHKTSETSAPRQG